MSTSTLLRRAGATLVASAVTISLVAAGGAAQAAPADRGVHWLSGQLTDGLIVSSYEDPANPGTYIEYDDYGLSIDTAFAFKAVGGEGSQVRAVRDAVAGDVDLYIGSGSERYVGETAKTLELAQFSGADSKNFGGVNLIRRLNGLVIKSGHNRGRVANVSSFPDYASTISQILAARTLTKAGSGQGPKVRGYLLKQQCDSGYFRLLFSPKKAANQSCTKKSPADPDATAYAVVQLWKVSKDYAKLRGALKDAVAWLAKHQRKSGAFNGGTSTDVANSNSTGLAVWALGLAGRCAAAKAGAQWIAALQVGAQRAGSALEGQRGAIAYDKPALRAGKKDGIPVNGAGQDQWRRATTQAAPALQYLHGC
jgi:hypothetical protein